MDPRELEALARRLGENPNDTEALNAAYAHGQQDPRSYAVFLERAGAQSLDAPTGAHWFCEAATVWTASLGDAHRAERALMHAADRDPLHEGATTRLIQLYEEKGNTKAIASLQQRRAKNVEKRLEEEPDLASQLGAIYGDLARLYTEELNQPDRAIDAFKKAAQYNPTDAYAIYQARELLKGAGRLREALPFFQAEQKLIAGDAERQVTLYQDEAEVCRQLGDNAALLVALKGARSLDLTDDPNLKQQLASTVLQLKQSGHDLPQEDIDDAALLFVSLAETYDGEHGHSYSLCALELQPENDRAAQLAMYYGEQIGQALQSASAIAGYLQANPNGAVAADARDLVSRALGETGDQALIDALVPDAEAPPTVKLAAFSTIARALVAQRRPREAAKYFAQVVAIDPADEEAVTFVAETLRGKNDKALRDLLAAAAREESAAPEQRKVWFSELAALCEGPLRDVESAIEARRYLVTLDPGDDEAADQLELSLERARKWQELAELLVRRAEYDTDEEARLARELRAADIYRNKLSDTLLAAQALGRAVHIDPDDETRAFEAVDLFVGSDRPEEGRILLGELLAAEISEEARASYSERLAELLVEAGYLVEAGSAYAEAATATSSPDLWKRAQTCFSHGENWQQAAQAVAQRRALVQNAADKALLCAEEADYLERLGDTEGALGSLREALSLDPHNQTVGDRLEVNYFELGRFDALIELLLSRAELQTNEEERVATRKRAAFLQRDEMQDVEGMRQALLLVLQDVEDPETLLVLADLAEGEGNPVDTIAYLRRLEASVDEAQKVQVALRLAHLLSQEGDAAGALSQYQIALAADADNVAILTSVAQLQQQVGQAEESAESYQRLLPMIEGDARLAAARALAALQSELGRLDDAIDTYKVVLSLDEEDFEAVANVRDLAEKAEQWEDYVFYHTQLVELEGDQEEASSMALRLSQVLLTQLKRPDDALSSLIPFAREGDAACLAEFERLGDALGKQGQVAQALVEWMKDAEAGPEKTDTLRRAYDKFLEVDDKESAIAVAMDLFRMRAADEELARSVESTASAVDDTEALLAAFEILGSDLSGAARAEEMVRQAEVLAAAQMPAEDAVLHGEQALSSSEPDSVESLLARLAQLSRDADGAISIYERQVTRCKSPGDRIGALIRAAEVAAGHEQLDRVEQLFENALEIAGPADHLDELRERARKGDKSIGGEVLRETLCRVLSESGAGARDGGKTRAAYLARASEIAFSDLEQHGLAFERMGEALVAHADEEKLDQLQQMGEKVSDLSQVAQVIGSALEQVHDGPLVRMLLRRRFELRSGPLEDESGAAEDLKRLYDLSPADRDIADQLEQRYTAASDHRGLVQLYEDQILRGRDQSARAELARKVALLWQDVLQEPREAADAWRRVLRMNSGSEEAKEGLSRAKKAMRKVSAKDVAASEEETRRVLEAREEQERREAEERHAELERKAAELKARHSMPPASIDDWGPSADADQGEEAEESPGGISEAPVPEMVETQLGAAAEANADEDETPAGPEAEPTALEERTTEEELAPPSMSEPDHAAVAAALADLNQQAAAHEPDTTTDREVQALVESADPAQQDELSPEDPGADEELMFEDIGDDLEDAEELDESEALDADVEFAEPGENISLPPAFPSEAGARPPLPPAGAGVSLPPPLPGRSKAPPLPPTGSTSKAPPLPPPAGKSMAPPLPPGARPSAAPGRRPPPPPPPGKK